MSVYFIKARGWRFDFTLKGVRQTQAWFKTKTEAKQAEAKRREEIANPEKQIETEKTQTDMAFLELVNKRLDHVKAYNSDSHYGTYLYLARRWVKEWGDSFCNKITQEMVQDYILERRKVSAFTANKDLRYLRSTFNYGLKKKFIKINPANEIEFFPVEKKIKDTPSTEDIDKVIEIADSNTQDYLWTIRETMARVGEINRLTWDDVNFNGQYVILYTRKKKGGHLTPRKVPMSKKLFEILSQRYLKRDKSKPWIFWHTFWSSKTGDKKEGPYTNRKRIMRSLCKKAG